MKFLSFLLVILMLTGCLQLKIAGANLPARFSDFEVEQDISYGNDEWQKLDIYTPPKDGKKHPVIVFFYGGRWTSGAKDMYLFAAQPFVDRGYIVIIPDYIKYPQGKFPQFLEDGAKAVKWTHENVEKYGADKERIYLMGHSAGGYIATLLAVNPQYLKAVGGNRKWIRAVAALASPHDFDPIKYELDGIFGKMRKEIHPETFVDKSDPPFLLLHGLNDDVVVPEQSKTMEAIMKKNKVKVRAIYYEGADHRDLVAAMSIPLRGVAPVVSDVINFFQCQK